MSTKPFAIGALVVVMVIWGSAFVVTKAVEAEVPPLLLALLRFVVACAFLIPFAEARGGLALLPRPVPWNTLALMGLTGVALYFATSNLALLYTTASDAALIQGSIPAVTAVLAVLFLAERVDRRRAVGIALSLIGVGVVVLSGRPAGDAPHRAAGDLLMFGTVLAWSVYTILGKRLQDAPQMAVTAYSTLLGTLFLLPAGLAELAVHPPRTVSLAGLLTILYLGAISSALAYLFWNRALPFLDASEHANFLNLVPVVGVGSAVLFLGEAVAALQAVGGIMVLVGVWMTAHSPSSGPERGASSPDRRES